MVDKEAPIQIQPQMQLLIISMLSEKEEIILLQDQICSNKYKATRKEVLKEIWCL